VTDAMEGTLDPSTQRKWTTRAVMIAVVVAVAAGGAGGWAFGRPQADAGGEAKVAQPGDVVRFDLFETTAEGSRYVLSVSTWARPGEGFSGSTRNCPARLNYVVCEENEDSVNPCGPQGPAADAKGNVSVLWDAQGRVVGKWTPESERRDDS